MAVHKDECGSGVSSETIGTGKQPSEPGHVVSLLHFGPMALNVPDGRCADVAVWRPRHHGAPPGIHQRKRCHPGKSAPASLIAWAPQARLPCPRCFTKGASHLNRSEEHTSELQSLRHLV